MNWGYKITIGIVAFMCFILFMVGKAFNRKIELVSEDYYERELNFQDVIDAKINAKKFDSKLESKITEDFLEIHLISSVDFDEAQGSLLLFKPDNSEFDKEFDLDLNNSKQIIPKSSLAKGRYFIQATFELNNESYFIEQEIFI